MLKFHAHDTVNDIALIKTAFCYNVRYGLQIESFDTIVEALKAFSDCQNHALWADIALENMADNALEGVEL